MGFFDVILGMTQGDPTEYVSGHEAGWARPNSPRAMRGSLHTTRAENYESGNPGHTPASSDVFQSLLRGGYSSACWTHRMPSTGYGDLQRPV